MATLRKTQEGFNMVIMNATERKAFDQIMSAKLYNENTPFFTPCDNLKFFYIKEVEVDYMNRETTIRANGKIVLVKHTFMNSNTKIDKAVRKAYGK
jgi:hypothetical protein